MNAITFDKFSDDEDGNKYLKVLVTKSDADVQCEHHLLITKLFL
jgi:hypothetical protein